MAQNIDLTLPATAPAAYLSQERETENFILPLYTLLPLSDDELRNIARACESDAANEDGDLVRLAPEPRFNSQSLRAVYDRHLELGVQGEFDPVHFAVVVDQDWKTSGVLLVTLEDDDEPPAVSSFMCKPEGVGLAVQNLQIANMSWEDCEEMWGIVNEDGSGDEDDNEGDEDEEKKDESPTDAEEGQSDDEGPAYPPKKPAYDYLIPIYILESADADAVIASLEEDADGKPNPFTDYRIRNQANLKPTEDGGRDMAMLSKPDPTITNDLVAQACALHPIRCRANKWLNKTHFLVCDTTQPSESGILIVKLAWDGITTGRSKAELRAIGTDASKETSRLPGTSDMGIKYGYVMVVDDLSVMTRTHAAFALFQLNIDMPHHGAKLVDAQHWDRKQRDEVFIVAWGPDRLPGASPPAAEKPSMRWTLDEAVNRFAWFCYETRFEPLFNRQYFVWFDHESVEEQGVTLVRYDWDEDVERSEAELWDFRGWDAVRTMLVPAEEAMARMEKAAADGTDEWAWEAYNA
jgi:hypothetical protein